MLTTRMHTSSTRQFTMGTNTSPEALAVRWTEVMHDPLLRDFPYKIELNAWGKIEMSPASNRHARLQALVAAAFVQQLPDGIVLTECSVLTDIGVRVPDVAWCSAQFWRQHGESTPYPAAPDICIEIVSPSNSSDEIREKTRAYLAAGAQEVWIIGEDASIHRHAASGELAASRYSVHLDLPKPAAGSRDC